MVSLNSTVTAVDTELDQESRLAHDDHEALRLWLRLLTCTNLIESEIRVGLRDTFEVTLPRFDLMAQLYRHPDGMKMGELSRRLMVTGGNVTGLADQLEREGLVVRSAAPEDKRSFLLALTKTGREVFATMAARHETWVEKLFSGLSPREQAQLYKLLAKLKVTLKEASAP
jgi:DNA-binding MarR family transcriptional regulator